MKAKARKESYRELNPAEAFKKIRRTAGGKRKDTRVKRRVSFLLPGPARVG